VSDSYVSDVEAYVLFYRSVSGSLHLAGFFITLSPSGPFASNSFFRPKTISRVAIIKTSSTTIAFFSSPPFRLLALSFSPFIFLCYYDCGASQAEETCLLAPSYTQMTANFSRLVFEKSAIDVRYKE